MNNEDKAHLYFIGTFIIIELVIVFIIFKYRTEDCPWSFNNGPSDK